MRFAAPAAVAALVLAAAPAALADTLKVPSQDYPTIQSAVDAAADGDLVLVGPGTYAETLGLDTRTGITLRGIGKPTITPPGPYPVIIMDHCSGISFSGFALHTQSSQVVHAWHCTDVSFEKIAISGTVAYGFSFLQDAGVLVSKCTVEGASEAGLDDQSSTGLVIEKCTFTGGNNGLFLSDDVSQGSDGAVVSKNRFTGCASGIVGGGFDMLVEKNRIEGTTQYGIAMGTLVPGGDGTVSKNRISANGGTGIYGFYSGFTLDRNVVVGAGIGFAGANLILTGNTVSGAGNTGIVLTGPNPLVSGNRVRDPDSVGIETAGSGAVIERNQVAGAPGTGIHVLGNSSIVGRNRVSGGGDFGFLVESAGCTFTGNKASGSALFDLADVHATGVNTYDGNHFGEMVFEYTP